MANPKVTIVTITYNLIKANREAVFRQCVESVHNQIYENIEHIIIDGASTDGTLDLINEYVEKGWVTCYSESDNGVYDAMNKGLAKANGKYINYLNSDDFFCCNDAVKSSIKILEFEKSDIIASNHNILNENGSLNSDICISWDNACMGQFPCHQTVFYKTDFFRKIGGYHTEFIDADNISFLMFKYNNAKFSYNKKTIITFRSGGISSVLDRVQAKKQFLDIFYSYWGEKWGLTIEESGTLYGLQYLNLPRADLKRIIKKIKIKKWKNKIQHIYDKRTNTIDYKLFNLIPIFLSFDEFGARYSYFLGIPYSSVKQNGEEKIIRTFFKMFKKKKYPTKTAYYFLGIKFLTKKKSKNYARLDEN